jgi:hypothetical protein
MQHVRHFLLAIAATAVLAAVLYTVFGVGESLRPAPPGPALPQLVRVPR